MSSSVGAWFAGSVASLRRYPTRSVHRRRDGPPSSLIDASSSRPAWWTPWAPCRAASFSDRVAVQGASGPRRAPAARVAAWYGPVRRRGGGGPPDTRPRPRHALPVVLEATFDTPPMASSIGIACIREICRSCGRRRSARPSGRPQAVGHDVDMVVRPYPRIREAGRRGVQGCRRAGTATAGRAGLGAVDLVDGEQLVDPSRRPRSPPPRSGGCRGDGSSSDRPSGDTAAASRHTRPSAGAPRRARGRDRRGGRCGARPRTRSPSWATAAGRPPSGWRSRRSRTARGQARSRSQAPHLAQAAGGASGDGLDARVADQHSGGSAAEQRAGHPSARPLSSRGCPPYGHLLVARPVAQVVGLERMPVAGLELRRRSGDRSSLWRTSSARSGGRWEADEALVGRHPSVPRSTSPSIAVHSTSHRRRPGAHVPDDVDVLEVLAPRPKYGGPASSRSSSRSMSGTPPARRRCRRCRSSTRPIRGRGRRCRRSARRAPAAPREVVGRHQHLRGARDAPMAVEARADKRLVGRSGP